MSTYHLLQETMHKVFGIKLGMTRSVVEQADDSNSHDTKYSRVANMLFLGKNQLDKLLDNIQMVQDFQGKIVFQKHLNWFKTYRDLMSLRIIDQKNVCDLNKENQLRDQLNLMLSTEPADFDKELTPEEILGTEAVHEARLKLGF